MTLEATLKVDANDEVDCHFQVENTGMEPVDVTFRSGKRTDVAIYDVETDDLVWRWSDGRLFTQALETVSVFPDETLERVHTWKTPTAGEYVAVGTLEADDDVTARTTFQY